MRQLLVRTEPRHLIERGAGHFEIHIAARRIHEIGSCAHHVSGVHLRHRCSLQRFKSLDLIIRQLELLTHAQQVADRTAAAGSDLLVHCDLAPRAGTRRLTIEIRGLR